MAKSTKDFFNAMLAEKQTMADLNGWLPESTGADSFLEKIDNKSKVSYWERFIWVSATGAKSLSDLFDLFKADLEEIAKKSNFGNALSYIAVAKAFQYGDNLVKVNNRWVYPDTSDAQLAVKRIIAFAALTEAGEELTLKVATIAGGIQQALDDAQLQAFTAYMAFLKPPGINLSIVSTLPDLLWLIVSINYDPILLKANGESILFPGTYPAEEAANAYIQTVNSGFTGKFENDKFIDFIQAARGVTNAYITTTKGKANGGAYGAAFTESYVAVAGYVKVDPSNTLSSTFAYFPNV